MRAERQKAEEREHVSWPRAQADAAALLIGAALLMSRYSVLRPDLAGSSLGQDGQQLDHSITKYSRLPPPTNVSLVGALQRPIVHARVWTRVAPGLASHQSSLEAFTATHPKGLRDCHSQLVDSHT